MAHGLGTRRYGDITPATRGGRVFAIFYVLFVVGNLAVISAALFEIAERRASSRRDAILARARLRVERRRQRSMERERPSVERERPSVERSSPGERDTLPASIPMDYAELIGVLEGLSESSRLIVLARLSMVQDYLLSKADDG